MVSETRGIAATVIAVSSPHGHRLSSAPAELVPASRAGDGGHGLQRTTMRTSQPWGACSPESR